jgi:hypothetical protein
LKNYIKNKELNDIIESIKILQSIPGMNDKKKYLKEIDETPAFKSIFKKYLSYVYDVNKYVYNKSKLPNISNLSHSDKNTDTQHPDNILDTLYNVLDVLCEGLRGKEADKLIIKSIDSALTDIDYENVIQFYTYVFKRDIKAKIGKKIFNDILGTVAPITPYMRCEQEKMIDKRFTEAIWEEGVYAQTKADGLFCNILIGEDGKLEVLTRQGKKAPIDNFFTSFAIPALYGHVLHGELLLKNKNGVGLMSREIGNGFINSYFKREITTSVINTDIDDPFITDSKKKKLTIKLKEYTTEWNETQSLLLFKAWDMIPIDKWRGLEYKVPYDERFKNLVKKTVDIPSKYIQIIDTLIVHSLEDAMNFYKAQLSQGEEGAIIKNKDSYWAHDINRTGIIKLKDFNECDLRIVGFNHGDVGSKYETGIGSLRCESEDGIVKVDISGMSDAQRGFERVDVNDSSKGIKLIDDFDLNKYNGKIAAVKYSYRIGDSLYLPSFIEIRDESDKAVADNSEKIK